MRFNDQKASKDGWFCLGSCSAVTLLWMLFLFTVVLHDFFVGIHFDAC